MQHAHQLEHKRTCPQMSTVYMMYVEMLFCLQKLLHCIVNALTPYLIYLFFYRKFISLFFHFWGIMSLGSNYSGPLNLV